VTGRATLVRTEKIPDPGALQDLLPDGPAFAFLQNGEGLVGWGELTRFELSGPDRFAAADRWWRSYAAGLTVEDEVGVPGSGPIALASFAFADGPAPSALIVPRVVIGRRHGITWRTTLGPAAESATPTLPRPPVGVRIEHDETAVENWRRAVRDAVAAIRADGLAKVVLAMPLEARAAEPVDPRALLGRLLGRYPDCWGFLVDGLVGATPELLVERNGLDVRSRVLAGTLPRSDNSDATSVVTALLASAKDLSEHRLAVGPVAELLRSRLDAVLVPDGPRVLELANVVHLATDFSGRLRDDSSVLQLAGTLHPTPAVAGTPTAAALQLIETLEPFDRARYAGPVGWTDANGDGELCLALRCAAVEGDRVRMYAGCGIVADSDADAEVAEWQAKLRPMLDALGH
jgi:menaquinone-specific isochorismate synthase